MEADYAIYRKEKTFGRSNRHSNQNKLSHFPQVRENQGHVRYDCDYMKKATFAGLWISPREKRFLIGRRLGAKSKIDRMKERELADGVALTYSRMRDVVSVPDSNSSSAHEIWGRSIRQWRLLWSSLYSTNNMILSNSSLLISNYSLEAKTFYLILCTWVLSAIVKPVRWTKLYDKTRKWYSKEQHRRRVS